MPTPRRANTRIWMLAADFGWMLLAGILLFGGLGYWLDGRMHTAGPWFTITGVMLGLVTAFSSLFRRLAKAEQDERLERRGALPEKSHDRDAPR